MIGRPYIYKLVLTFCFVILFSISSYARKEVYVSAYVFPPFFNEDLSTGLTPELIKLLNISQEKYNFILTPTSPKRRYDLFHKKKVDLMFFEMDNWGWKSREIPITLTREIMRSEEVYIALRKTGRDKSFFEDIEDKKISAFFGYHYGFANFNSDPNWLKQNFNIVLNHSHERNVDLVLHGAVDIGVVTKSFLEQFLRKHPKKNQKIMISEIPDQIYKLPIMISNNSILNVEEFEIILDNLKNTGQLYQLFRSMGLEKGLVY